VAADAFQRAVSSGWGAADTGGSWSIVQGTATEYSVDGARGAIITPSGGSPRLSVLSQTSARDVSFTAAIAFDSAVSGTGKLFGDVVVRRQGGAHYRIGVNVNANGAVWLRGQNSSAQAVLPAINTGLTYAPGEVILLKVEVEGASPTSISAKVWKHGMAEPSTWTQTATDSTAGVQTPGSVGVRSSNTTGSSNIVMFDDIVVTTLP
jgi:hypothetical protein